MRRARWRRHRAYHRKQRVKRHLRPPLVRLECDADHGRWHRQTGCSELYGEGRHQCHGVGPTQWIGQRQGHAHAGGHPAKRCLACAIHRVLLPVARERHVVHWWQVLMAGLPGLRIIGGAPRRIRFAGARQQSPQREVHVHLDVRVQRHLRKRAAGQRLAVKRSYLPMHQ